MKDLNIFIECDNLEQRNNAINVLESMGFKTFDPDESFKNLRVMEGEYFDINFKPSPDAEKFTYQQFMEKYSMNKMHQKINETKVTLGMDNKRLSLALGHHRNYIARVLKNEHSEKFDQNLIKQLDDLIESKKIKVEELPKFVLSKEQCNSCRDAFVKDNADLKKQLEYKTELLARKEDEISSLKSDLEKHKVWLEIESAYSDGTDKTISKLEKEIKVNLVKFNALETEFNKKEFDFNAYKNKSNINKVLISLFLFACFSVGFTYILLNH